jgi:hypothetical protein
MSNETLSPELLAVIKDMDEFFLSLSKLTATDDPTPVSIYFGGTLYAYYAGVDDADILVTLLVEDARQCLGTNSLEEELSHYSVIPTDETLERAEWMLEVMEKLCFFKERV